MSYKNGKYYFPSWAWILIYLITWVVIDQLLIPTKWNAGRLWLTRVALLTLTTILFTKIDMHLLHYGTKPEADLIWRYGGYYFSVHSYSPAFFSALNTLKSLFFR